MIDFIKGLAIGATVSLPIGPIGILCVRRLLLNGPLVGIAAGMGAATADIFYAVTALLGLTFVSQLLMQQFVLLRILGSFFFFLFGIKILISHPPRSQKSNSKWAGSAIQSYFSLLLLTLANPTMIFYFIALFATFQIENNTLITIIPLTIGIFFGALGWWLLLSLLSTLIHPTLNAHLLRLINKICGIALIIVSILSSLSLLIK
jgi:threonine/homoserine/homoserine lactone efflux protein